MFLIYGNLTAHKNFCKKYIHAFSGTALSCKELEQSLYSVQLNFTILLNPFLSSIRTFQHNTERFHQEFMSCPQAYVSGRHI